MARPAGRRHARRRIGAGAGARQGHGAAAARAARGLRPAHRHAGAAQHVVQRRRRADRQRARSKATRRSGAAASTCSSPARPSSPSARPPADIGEGGLRMIKKRGGMRRRLIVLGTAGGSIADLVRGLWRRDSGKRWLAAARGVPLPVRVHPDCRGDRRSAGAVHLRDLLSHGRLPGAARLPGVRRRDRGALVVRGLRPDVRRRRRRSQSAAAGGRANRSRPRVLRGRALPRLSAERDALQASARAPSGASSRGCSTAPIPGDARIVEVGCGTGQMCLYLARADRVVIGADLTRASLRLGAAAAARFKLDRVHFIETDLGRPGLKAGAFDLVYSSGVLHHTPDPRASFARLAPLARPGGIIVVGALQRVRAHSVATAPRRRAPVRLPLRAVRSRAARSHRRPGAPRRVAARSVPPSRRASPHPRRGPALVRRQPRRIPPQLSRARCSGTNRTNCSPPRPTTGASRAGSHSLAGCTRSAPRAACF